MIDAVDLFVIGGGSGGVRAARIAAGHGAKVAIAEQSRWGGTCVVRGCVPKKLLVFGSAVRAQLDDARAYGWTIEGTHDWATLRDNVGREVTRLSGLYAANLDRAGVVRLEGRAIVKDPGTVELDGHAVRARTILVATGGAPRRPAIPGAEQLIVSDDVFTLPALPKELLIIGGGYIGVEFAHVFAGLGVKVTLAHKGELPLRGFDHDLREAVATNLRARGVDVLPMCEPLRVDQVGGRLAVTLSGGHTLSIDVALAAVGRTPVSGGFGLEALGVERDGRGGLLVDEWQATSVAGIYAVGDVTGRIQLTPIAIREGHAFADSVFGGRPTPFRPAEIPTAVFAQPALATVGLSEEAARARGDVAVYRSQFRPMRHTVSGRDEKVLIKMVCDAATRRVLGLHVVGDDAPEIVQAAAVAITMGATKDDFDRTVALHPTVAEELVLLR